MSEIKALLTLAQIKPGKLVRIVGFSLDDVPLKLLEMGLLPGNEILVKRIAPLFDPIQVVVSGYDLALRKSEAQLILVEELG